MLVFSFLSANYQNMFFLCIVPYLYVKITEFGFFSAHLSWPQILIENRNKVFIKAEYSKRASFNLKLFYNSFC